MNASIRKRILNDELRLLRSRNIDGSEEMSKKQEMDKLRVDNARPVNDLEYTWRGPELTERFNKCIDELALLGGLQLVPPRIEDKPPLLTRSNEMTDRHLETRHCENSKKVIQLSSMTS